MYDFFLPTETLEIIIEEVMSDYEDTRPKHPLQIKFIPRWYLLPILRVSKLWYAIGNKYLYQATVGSSAPFQYRHRSTKRGMRMEYEVAEDLYKMLKRDPRTASSVKKLQLGIEVVDYERRLEWMQMNTGILQLCPNVVDVEISRVDREELVALVKALQNKSLVSFSISGQYLLESAWGGGGCLSQIFHMMQKWPKLRSIRMKNFLDLRAEESLTRPPLEVSVCCPDLQEIIISGATLAVNGFKALLSVCSIGIEKLGVSLYSDAAVNTLCECLQAWSSTLQCFKFDALRYRTSYQPLMDIITTLRELRELQSTTMKLDFGSICRLPKLECFFCIVSYNREELETLFSLLENSENFSSLNLIVLDNHNAISSYLRNICYRRNIILKNCSHHIVDPLA